MKRTKPAPNLRQRTTRGPATRSELKGQVELSPGAPVADQGGGVSPTETRRKMIAESAKHEKSAARAYRAALEAANACDPLSEGYEECQSRLHEAAQNLLLWRESHRDALAGRNAPPEAE